MLAVVVEVFTSALVELEAQEAQVVAAQVELMPQELLVQPILVVVGAVVRLLTPLHTMAAQAVPVS
jgi:hypothetical protein